MVAGERLERVPLVEHLSDDRLASLLEASASIFTTNQVPMPAIQSYLHDLRFQSNVRGLPHILWDYTCSTNPATTHIAHALYPNSTPDELDTLVQIDAVALGELSSFQFGLNDSRNNLDWRLFEPYLRGSHSRLWGVDDLLRFDNTTQLVLRRKQEGAPRELLLLAATDAMERANSPAYLQEIIERFSLSDAEFQTCYHMSNLAQPDNLNVIRYALQDTKLMATLLLLPTVLSSPQLQSALEVLFTDQQAWSNCQNSLNEAQLATLLPPHRRQELALASIADAPRVPADYLLPYIDLKVIADITHAKITAELRRKKASWMLETADAAEHFGINGEPWRLAAMEQRHGYISTLTLITPASSDLAEQAVAWQQSINSIDPQLTTLLDSYSGARHSASRPWPIQGWSGAPEENSIVAELIANREADNQRYREAKEQLEAYIAATIIA